MGAPGSLGSVCEATYGQNVIFVKLIWIWVAAATAVLQACKTDTQTTLHVGFGGLPFLLPPTMKNDNTQISSFSDRRFSVSALLFFFKHGTKGVQIHGGWLNGWQNLLENGMMHQPNSSSSLSGSACEATYGRNVIFLNCFGDSQVIRTIIMCFLGMSGIFGQGGMFRPLFLVSCGH